MIPGKTRGINLFFNYLFLKCSSLLKSLFLVGRSIETDAGTEEATALLGAQVRGIYTLGKKLPVAAFFGIIEIIISVMTFYLQLQLTSLDRSRGDSYVVLLGTGQGINSLPFFMVLPNTKLWSSFWRSAKPAISLSLRGVKLISVSAVKVPCC